MDLQKIPNDVQVLLSASSKINNFKRVTEELVYNSVDAESTSVAIRINIQNHWLQVVDNGTGIKQADFKLLGERYATSKLVDISTLKAAPRKYGFQGQALANIIEVSQMVKITSRCVDSNDTWIKTFFEGKVRECHDIATRPSKGTTVEVNGFLFNLNIQKKSINAFNELQDIKLFLEQLKLVFNNVSISLRDDSVSEIIFRIPKNRDFYQTMKTLFEIDSNNVKELKIEKNMYKIKAYIGIEDRDFKNYQWIYLNSKYVHTSNIHKLVNDKISTSTKINCRKIINKKRLKRNNEESIENKNVPFYFLFITCPYYEYDIVNSGKQTIVEFKNWEQINKIIEKLVKFYFGDVHLKNMQHNDIKNQQQIPNNSEDTRKEVARIMDKILGNYKNTLKVSQMRNGVKGSLIRRAKRKNLGEINKRKLTPKNRKTPNFQHESLNKNNLPTKNNDNNFNENPKLNNQITDYKNIKKKKIIPKQVITCKCKKKYKLCENFRNEVNSNKGRCGDIKSNDTMDLVNFDNYKAINEKSYKMTDIIEKPVTKVVNKNYVLNNKLSELISKGPKNPETLTSVNNKKMNKPREQYTKSYDLLQTILMTQKPVKNQAYKEDFNKNIQKSSRASCENSFNFVHKLTFDSHKHNFKNLEHKIRAEKLNSKQSRSNLTIDDNNNFQRKMDKMSKIYDVLEPKAHNTNNIWLQTKYRQTELGTSNESNIIEFAKRIRKQVLNDMSLLFNSNNCDKFDDDECTEQVNYGVSFNLRSTYRVLLESFNNSSQVAQVHQSCQHQTFLHMDFSRDLHKPSMRNPDVTNMNRDECINKISIEKCNADIMVSTCTTDEPMDPVTICKAVIDTSKEIQNKDALIINELNENIDAYFAKPWNSNEVSTNLVTNNSQINKSENAHLNRITSPVLIHTEIKEKTTKHPYYQQADNLKNWDHDNEDDIRRHNSLLNFKLNNRQSFMPKGMSQIFNNCFSKNNCSYNLDSEYFKDVVYDNFIKHVTVNCENLEPNVQQMKDFTTEHVQKFTDKLKKTSSDLMFGTDSLAAAKVLGQVDSKFIAAVIKSTKELDSSQFLVLFDQHAVHERIRLENNLSYYIKGNNWKNVSLDEISLKIAKDDILYLHNHKDKFAQFGLQWTIINDSDIVVNAIPEAIMGRNPRPAETIMKFVKSLISEHIHALKYLKGNVSLYPQSIMNPVCSEACRYAIKFGDKLSLSDCCELIATLASCKTPFQCAHGRPVMAVMMELQNVHKKYKVDMQHISNFMKNTKQNPTIKRNFYFD